jgi:hypothetical protein
MRPCWPCSAHTLSLYMRIPSKGVRNVGPNIPAASSRARGDPFRAATRTSRRAGVRFRAQRRTVMDHAAGFSAPRDADRHTQGGARGGAAKPGGDEPLPQRILGATGPARECRAGEAGKPHAQAPPGAKAPDRGSVAGARSWRVNLLG